jgi:DNA-binding transcriptional LysR family regulator
LASSTNSRVRSSGLRAVTDVIATPFPPSPGWPARLPLAAAALSAVGGIRLAVSELTGLLRGQATIGTVTSPNVDLPGILAEFRRRHPLVEITLSEESTSDLLDGVRSGRLDGVIASVGTTPPPGVELQVIVDQPVVAAVSHDHELAARPARPAAL